MFGFLRKSGLSKQDRIDVQEYLRIARPKMEELEREFRSWMEVAADSQGELGLASDPDGQHAAVYLWRVSDAARDFVQHEPPKAAKQYHEAFSLCLEARAAAADALKEAADRAGVVDPRGKVGQANRDLEQAEDQLDRAKDGLDDIERRLATA